MIKPEVSFSEKYALTDCSLLALKSIKSKLKEDISQASTDWITLWGQEEDTDTDEETDTDTNNNSNDGNEGTRNKPPGMEFSLTQCYFAQANHSLHVESSIRQTPLQIRDIVESLYEGLEYNNGKFNLSLLESLSSTELTEVMTDLGKRLNSRGIYNLCCLLNTTDIEKKTSYSNLICTNVLLPKIIEFEQPSRILVSTIRECIEQFPDNVIQLIFIPLANVDLKDTVIVTTIINTLDVQRKSVLLREFVVSLKELKKWHISVLQILVSVKTDDATTDKLVNLFSDKAADFSNDKNFGKLILSFLKTQSCSDHQKSSLREIANANKTLYRKAILNMLTKM